jgi:hypothetical protein
MDQTKSVPFLDNKISRRLTLKMWDHPISAVRDCLLNVLVATFGMWSPPSPLRNLTALCLSCYSTASEWVQSRALQTLLHTTTTAIQSTYTYHKVPQILMPAFRILVFRNVSMFARFEAFKPGNQRKTTLTRTMLHYLSIHLWTFFSTFKHI